MKRRFCERLLQQDIFLEPVVKEKASISASAGGTCAQNHPHAARQKKRALDCVRQETTRDLQTVPLSHGVELHNDMLHGKGLRLNKFDKQVRQVGHAGHKHITNVTFLM